MKAPGTFYQLDQNDRRNKKPQIQGHSRKAHPQQQLQKTGRLENWFQ